MKLALMASAAVALALTCSVAFAAAVPVSPSPGSTVASSLPAFAWELPPNEEASAIQMASKPDLDAEGYFLKENQVVLADLEEGDNSWSSRDELLPGHYWWSVRTLYDDGAGANNRQPRWSTPIDFSVPLELSLQCAAKVYKSAPRYLAVSCSWFGNVRASTLKWHVSTRGKGLASGRYVNDRDLREYTVGYGWAWKAPRSVKRGQRVALTVRLLASENGFSGEKEYRASLRVK